jgi:hypothetical protein
LSQPSSGYSSCDARDSKLAVNVVVSSQIGNVKTRKNPCDAVETAPAPPHARNQGCSVSHAHSLADRISALETTTSPGCGITASTRMAWSSTAISSPAIGWALLVVISIQPP